MLDKHLKDFDIILGSASPRRKELLAGLDLDFRIVKINADESFDKEMELHRVPVFLAEKKSLEYDGELKEKEILITADTVVIIQDEILNKPSNKLESFEMLKKLSGNRHEVVTGVCIRSKNKTKSFSDLTAVHFNELSDEEIEYYIKKYQPFDKAGSYGIQEWIGYVAIYGMEGCFYNVMGLPLPRLYHELKLFVDA